MIRESLWYLSNISLYLKLPSLIDSKISHFQRVIKSRIRVEMILLFGCNLDESTLKRYNVSSDEWIVMDGQLKQEDGSIYTGNGSTVQSSTSLNKVTFFTTYSDDEHLFSFDRSMPLYFSINDNEKPLMHNRILGPCFGDGDIVIGDKCNENDENQSNFKKGMGNLY